jgi:hypothetical protein
MRAGTLSVMGLGGLIMGLAGCGGPHFDGRLFENSELGFRVGPAPDSWRPIQAEAALLAFRDDSTAATIAVNGRCGLDGDDVPLTSLTHHLFLHFRERHVIDQRRLELDGREALRTELIAELDGVPKHYVVYVLKKNGCVYDFLRIAENQAGDEPFDDFVQSFSTVRP